MNLANTSTRYSRSDAKSYPFTPADELNEQGLRRQR